MNIYSKLLGLGLTLGLGACASIIEGESDRVELATQQNIAAQCQLKNGRGSYNISAPGSAEIKKSKTDLDISCQAADGTTATKVVQSNMEDWFLGNIVFGGIIGGGVDAATGSMWEYPKEVSINMTPIVQPSAYNAPYNAPAPVAPAQQSYAPANQYAPAGQQPVQYAPVAQQPAQPQVQYAPVQQQQPVQYAPVQPQVTAPQPQAQQPVNYGTPANQLPILAPAN